MMISRSGNVDQRCLDPLIKATNKDQDRGLNACIPGHTVQFSGIALGAEIYKVKFNVVPRDFEYLTLKTLGPRFLERYILSTYNHLPHGCYTQFSH